VVKNYLVLTFIHPYLEEWFHSTKPTIIIFGSSVFSEKLSRFINYGKRLFFKERKMIRGNIIRILSDKEVVLNVGTKDSVGKEMRSIIYCYGPDVIDP
jgi:hypothetical protein